MKFEAITIKDIAKALKLSTSTVSRALRDSYEISEETKQKVREYAEINNYKPNPIALSLKERKTRSIGLIVSEIANSFFSQLIDGVESIAYTNGYNVNIYQTKESFEKESMILQYIASRSIDGLIISVSAHTSNFNNLINLNEKGMPIVFLDRVADVIETHKVTINNFNGSYEATKHLIQTGYKNIAAIASNINLSITKERIEGYKNALIDNYFKVSEEMIQYCQQGGSVIAEVEHAIDNIMKHNKKVDAIIALSDKITMGSLRILKQKNIKIPYDVALIGFSNGDVTELMDPPLSVIKQPAFEMGQVSATMLLELIESKKPVTAFEHKIMSPQVIIRKSTLKK